MGSEWILGRLSGGVEWTGGGFWKYGDEPAGSVTTQLVS
jgi:hypothetical protein